MRRLPLILAFAVLIGGFAYALGALFIMRYQAGDLHPAYSSLNPEPTGAKALHDALAEAPGLDVRRNFRPLAKLRPDDATTLFYIGMDDEAELSLAEVKTLEALLIDGLRVVIAFEPRSTKRLAAPARRAMQIRKMAKAKNATPPPATPAPQGKLEPAEPRPLSDTSHEDGELPLDFDALGERWGFTLDAARVGSDDEAEEVRAAIRVGDESERIEWRSILHFKNLSQDWKPVCTWKGVPAVIERRYAAGTIVLAADSFFLSNEALTAAHPAQFLAWLVGPARIAIFDEVSKGIVQEAGIMTLVRRYRLGGLAAALLLLTVLFIWKNSARFVPPYDELNTDGNMVMGRDSTEGFITLLRRTLPRPQLLAACIAEWRKSCARTAREGELHHVNAVLAAEDAKPDRQRNPATAYATIARELSRRPTINHPTFTKHSKA